MIDRRLVRLKKLRLLSLLTLAGAAGACSSSTEPHFRPCTAADNAVTLAVNQYISIDPVIDTGCMVFSATAGAAEYLVVPQLTSGVPGQITQFRLVGDTILPPPGPSPEMEPALMDLSPAERFHTYLRLGDERRSWGLVPEQRRGPTPQLSIAAGPPGMGTLRTFQVCAKTDCSRFDRVGARVGALKSKVAIYVDTLAPAGGLDSLGLDSIANLFEQRLYPIDTIAFGRESDIDANTVVMVLMTNTVNKLVTAADCNKSGFVAGFFFGADLDPAFQNDSRSNKGEVFYSIVADPAGTLSCQHTVSNVLTSVPVTFIHEFQHMISFNQHVLIRSGSGEVLWLNEGLSHYAEELGGRSYATTPDAVVSDCPANTHECQFYAGDLIDAYEYMDTVTKHFLLPTAGIGSLAERGAAWLFVRYVVDQYSAGSTRADWDALTRQLVGTTRTGADNIAAVAGVPFATVVTDWSLALYVTDRGGIPSALQYGSWNLHGVYAQLHGRSPNAFPKTYPLLPLVYVGRSVALTGTLRAGSGIYLRLTQPAADPGFTLSFTGTNGLPIGATFGPRLNVMRLQ